MKTTKQRRNGHIVTDIPRRWRSDRTISKIINKIKSRRLKAKRDVINKQHPQASLLLLRLCSCKAALKKLFKYQNESLNH